MISHKSQVVGESLHPLYHTVLWWAAERVTMASIYLFEYFFSKTDY